MYHLNLSYNYTIILFYMLKRSPSLTEQAKAHLKQRILEDEFVEGRIPSETDLAEALGVSRTTIRDALSRLELEGVVYRKQGAGTFVNKAGLQIKTRLEEIWTYEAMLEAHGYTPSTRILSVGEQPAKPELAATLHISGDNKVLVVKKLFLADGRPVTLTVNYLPTAIISQPYTNDDFRRPIYQFLLKFCQQHLTYYLSEITPLIAPAWLADTLDLPRRKTALLAFDEVGYNQDNEPVIKTYSYFRDDLLRLRLIRRETA
ncbi:MAG: GntR family transcriptional regulator [Anaerolineae bacterium]|nr:GntR family transcriptional regulator [Anaerolineae bacterium]